jgi:hypothetical protein
LRPGNVVFDVVAAVAEATAPSSTATVTSPAASEPIETGRV